MELLEQISEHLQKGKAKEVRELVQQAVDEGIPSQIILEEGLLSGMGIISEKFKRNEVFVPEVLVAARAMSQGAALLKPLLIADGVKARGRVCIGTVKGDLHDIGKNLVASMLEGCGFEVFNIGVDISSDRFIEAAREHRADILCMSALLTTTMTHMKEVIDALRASDLAGRVKVLVGGAPVTEGFARTIGADGYSSNANNAVLMARQLMGH